MNNQGKSWVRRKNRKGYYNISESQKRERKREIVSLSVSIVAIIVSVATYIHSYITQQALKVETERKNLLEYSKKLDIDSNIDFFMISLEKLISELRTIVTKKEMEVLWEVQEKVAQKEYSMPLSSIEKIRKKYTENAELCLLEAMLRTRNSFFTNCFIVGEEREIIEPLLNQAINNELNLDEHGIIVGVINYYLRDFKSSLQNIKRQQARYYSDSSYYDVANYWLARLSVETRVIYCEPELLFDSDYEKGLYTELLKTSISRMQTDSGIPSSFSLYHTIIRTVDAPFFDSSDFITEKYTDKELNNLGNFSPKLKIKDFIDLKDFLNYNWKIMEETVVYEFNRTSKQYLEEYISKKAVEYDFFGYNSFDYFRIPENEENAEESLTREISSLARIYSRYCLIPFSSPLLLNYFVEDYVYQMIMLYSVCHSESYDKYTQMFYKKVISDFSYCSSDDIYNMATKAAAMLYYYQYIHDEIDNIDKLSQLALIAYEGGFRMKCIFEYLQVYYSNDDEMLEKLEEEMKQLEIYKTVKCSNFEN